MLGKQGARKVTSVRLPGAKLVTMLCLSALIAPTLSGQTLADLPAGTRIRLLVASPAKPLEGTLLVVDSGSLILRDARSDLSLTLAIQSIHRAEMSIGFTPPRDRFKHGAKIGALVGLSIAAVGISVVYLSDADELQRMVFPSNDGRGDQRCRIDRAYNVDRRPCRPNGPW